MLWRIVNANGCCSSDCIWKGLEWFECVALNRCCWFHISRWLRPYLRPSKLLLKFWIQFASSLHPACVATLNWRGAGMGWLLELHRWGRDSWRSSSALDILYLCRRLFLVDGWRCVSFDHGPAILVPTVWVWIRNHERQGAAYVPSFSLSCAAATF